MQVVGTEARKNRSESEDRVSVSLADQKDFVVEGLLEGEELLRRKAQGFARKMQHSKMPPMVRAVEPSSADRVHQGNQLAPDHVLQVPAFERGQPLEAQVAAVGDGGAGFEPDAAVHFDPENPLRLLFEAPRGGVFLAALAQKSRQQADRRWGVERCGHGRGPSRSGRVNRASFAPRALGTRVSGREAEPPRQVCHNTLSSFILAISALANSRVTSATSFGAVDSLVPDHTARSRLLSHSVDSMVSTS